MPLPRGPSPDRLADTSDIPRSHVLTLLILHSPKIAKAYSSGAVPKEHDMIAPDVWDFIKKVHAAGNKKR